MAINVLAIADHVHPPLYTYFHRDLWKEVDVILSAGDLPPEYLDFLCTELNIPVFYVRGNHDGEYASSRYNGFENLHGRIVEYRGLLFAGFEGSRRYKEGPSQYSEREMSLIAWRSQLKALRRGAPDVVLTHAPPAGIHEGPDVCHRGFECFARIIHAWQPAFFVHGHSHQYYGRELVGTLGNTTVINAFPVYRFQLPDRAQSIARSVDAPQESPSAAAGRRRIHEGSAATAAGSDPQGR